MDCSTGAGCLRLDFRPFFPTVTQQAFGEEIYGCEKSRSGHRAETSSADVSLVRKSISLVTGLNPSESDTTLNGGVWYTAEEV